MKDTFKYIVILLIGFFLGTYLSCEGDRDRDDPITIIIPEEGDTFIIDPKESEIEYRDSIVYRDKTIYIENPINEELLIEYNKAQDSLDKFKKYLEAITIREYRDTISDDKLEIKYYAKTTGTLDELKLDYVIKERELVIEDPFPKRREKRFQVGPKLNLPNQTESFNVEFMGGINLNNNKGVLLGSYNTNKQIGVGYLIRF